MSQPRAIVSDQSIRPGANDTGSDIAKYVAVTLDPTPTRVDPESIQLPAAGGKIYGVVVSSQVRAGVTPDVGIPDGYIGDIQIDGRTPALIGAGGVTVDDNLAVTTAGAFVTAATGNIIVAKAMETADAAAYAEVELVGPVQSFIAP